MNIYDEALKDWSADEDPESSDLLTRQWEEVGSKVRELPKDQ